MSGRSSSGRGARRRVGQHFLGSERLAAQLVEEAGITRDDRVVELGAGTGVLTSALAARAAHVLAIELDPWLVTGLVRRFETVHTVTVLRGDACETPLPATRNQVVANLPFHVTAVVLRGSSMTRACSARRADRGGISGVADGSRPTCSGRGRLWTPPRSS